MQEESLYPSPTRSKPDYSGSGRPADAPKIQCYIELRTAATHKTVEGHVRAASLLGLAILLAFVWVVSFIIFHVAGWLIHILLLLALIFLLLQLFTGRPTKL